MKVLDVCGLIAGLLLFLHLCGVLPIGGAQ